MIETLTPVSQQHQGGCAVRIIIACTLVSAYLLADIQFAAADMIGGGGWRFLFWGAGVRQEDLQNWVGRPASDLDNQPIWVTIPSVRTRTSDGTEIRNYVNGPNVASCSGGGTVFAEYVDITTYRKFSYCMQSVAACNNIFYIRGGVVTQYSPVGTGGTGCYTDERTGPDFGIAAKGQTPTRNTAPGQNLSLRTGQPSKAAVPLKRAGGTFLVPVQINGAVMLDFTVDSGAADVIVPADVFSTLARTGTIRESDIVGETTYVLADGSKSQSVMFTIRSLKVGNTIVENVRGGVTPSRGSLLLGQSFLERFKTWAFDNSKQVLLLEPK
jgi:clan AA aspartic protease (TIGR02281 family)